MPAMKPPPNEWWGQIFDDSYLRVYRFTDQNVDRDVAFLNDVLELTAGMSLLDVCCGYGRLSVPIARMGLRVTGLDFSADQLREAKRREKAARVRVEWVKADARDFRTRRRFDRVINMFTAFGYLETEAEDARMMERMAAVLKAGGALCIDTLNRDFITRHFHPTISFPIDGGHVIDTNRLDPRTGRLDVQRVVCESGKTLRQAFSLRLYTPRELILMAQSSGLDVTETYGSLDKQPLGPDASRLILIAHKP